MTGTILVKVYRYAVLDGRELVGIFDSYDTALFAAHLHELYQASLRKLVLCDVITVPRSHLIHGDNDNAPTSS